MAEISPQLYVHAPPGAEDPLPPWLSELVAFRARVLYADGRRTQIKAEVDLRDTASHHVVATLDNTLAGCWRLLPLEASVPGLCEVTFGRDPLFAALQERGVAAARAGEGGGWVVDPRYRKQRLGLTLWAAGAALATSLGYQAVVAAIGTRDGQADAIRICGGELLDSLGTPHDAVLDDELVLGVHCLDQGAPWFRALSTQLAPRLGLSLQTKE